MRSSFNQSLLSRINSSLPHHPTHEYIYIYIGWDCRLKEMLVLNLLFIYLFLCWSSSASAGVSCVIDLLWIRRKILNLFGLQTGAPCLSCGRKILKIDFPSRIASTAPATSPFFLFFFLLLLFFKGSTRHLNAHFCRWARGKSGLLRLTGQKGLHRQE